MVALYLGSATPCQEASMSKHVYKTIELTGSSTTSMEDAVKVAIAKAAESLHNLNWFEVVQTRGHINKDKVEHWQVTLKIGFRVD